MQKIRRALVVEDNLSWQQILAEILTDMELVVDVSGSLEAALAALRMESHDVAVVDLSLNDDPQNEDGLVVLDAVRRGDPGCTPILLSGFVTGQLAQRMLAEGAAYACLHKDGFRRAEFRKIVEGALARPLS